MATSTPRLKSLRPADQLSKGNQQKIQIMTALLSDPELIVPTRAFFRPLDPASAFRAIIRDEITKGKLSYHVEPPDGDLGGFSRYHNP